MYALFFLYYFGTTPEKAIFWLKGVYTGACFSSVLSYHFIISFLNIRKRPWVLYIFYGLSAFFLYLTYTNRIVGGVYYYAWGPWGKAGTYHTELMFYVLIESAYTLYLLFDKYSQRLSLGGQEFQRVKYVFLAFLVGHFCSTNFLPVYGINMFPLGNFFMAGLVVFLAYAIVRHQLLDIEVVIKRSLVFAGLLASVMAIIILPTLLMQELFFQRGGFGLRLVGLTISGTILIAVIRRIDNFLRDITDKFLFQKRYDYKRLIREFMGELKTMVLNAPDIAQSTLEFLASSIRPAKSAIFMHNRYTNKYDIIASKDIKDKAIRIPANSPLIKELEEKGDERQLLFPTNDNYFSPYQTFTF